MPDSRSRHQVIARSLIAIWALVFFWAAHKAVRHVIAEPRPQTNYLEQLNELMEQSQPPGPDAWPLQKAVGERINEAIGQPDTSSIYGHFDLAEALQHAWGSAELAPLIQSVEACAPLLTELKPIVDMNSFRRKRVPSPNWGVKSSAIPQITFSRPEPSFWKAHTVAVALRFQVETAGWADTAWLISVGLASADLRMSLPSKFDRVEGAMEASLLLREIRILVFDHPPRPDEADAIINAMRQSAPRLLSVTSFLPEQRLLYKEIAERSYSPGGIRVTNDWERIMWGSGGSDFRWRFHQLLAWRADTRTEYLMHCSKMLSDLEQFEGETIPEAIDRLLELYDSYELRLQPDRLDFDGNYALYEQMTLLQFMFMCAGVENDYRATEIAIRIAEFRRTNGHLPSSLDDLPIDPARLLSIQGAPFEYSTDYEALWDEYMKSLTVHLWVRGLAPAPSPPRTYSLRAPGLPSPLEVDVNEYIVRRGPYPRTVEQAKKLRESSN